MGLLAERMLRSILHGFATLEAENGFQIDADVEESSTWILTFIDHGLMAPRPHHLPAH